MKSDLRNLFLLMAGAGLTPQKVEEIMWEISKRSPQKIAVEYERQLRRLGVPVNESDGYQKRRQTPNHDIKTDAQSKAINLIKSGSALTVKESLEIFNRILMDTFPDRKFSAPNAKAGLAAWIRSLSRTLTESELLHVATKFRNQSAHSGADQQDWVLEEKNASSQAD
jgi:hypothetical protein